jgi:hypothetical protein
MTITLMGVGVYNNKKEETIVMTVISAYPQQLM